MIKDLAAQEAGSQRDLDDVRELCYEELCQVGGGLKWQRGTANDDVVDARGGSIQIFGLIGTFDINGNLSSVYEA